MTSTKILDEDRLLRLRVLTRGVLALGLGASLAANVLASKNDIVARLIAAWPPLALLLTVELISRLPVASGWLSRLRVCSAGLIAGIAGWVSYWHMVDVAAAYGEAPIAAHLIPLSVDGLVVVASVSLVELTDQLGRHTSSGSASTIVKKTGAEPGNVKPTKPVKPPKTQKNKPVANAGVGVRVRELASTNPGWTQARIAEAAECSVRTVRRHLNQPDPLPQPQREQASVDNGREAGLVLVPTTTVLDERKTS